MIAPHRPRCAEAQGPLVPARADGPARQDRDPPDRADHRAQRVQRDVLRRRPHAARERRRRGQRGLARRDGHARVRAGRVDARPAALVRERARRRSPISRAPTGSRTIRSSASDSPTRGSRCASCVPRVAHVADARARHGRSGHVDPQAVLGERFTAASASWRSTCWARSRWPRSTSDDRLTRLFLYSRADTIYGGVEPDPDAT